MGIQRTEAMEKLTPSVILNKFQKYIFLNLETYLLLHETKFGTFVELHNIQYFVRIYYSNSVHYIFQHLYTEK